MVNFIFLEDYKINKTLEKKIYDLQGVKGKIIETELGALKGGIIEGIRFEDSLALHTLRINIGEGDVVLHMAKEALRAVELESLKDSSDKKNILVKFRPDITRAHLNGEYQKFDLDFSDLEKGISSKTVKSLGEILKYHGAIKCIVPSWYLEDWVRIPSFRNNNLIIRMDSKSLYGIGFGKVQKSSSLPAYAHKKENIFYWDWHTRDKMERNYPNQGCGTDLYKDWACAKVKVKPTKKD